jgi:replicative DNA helicase
MSKPVQYNHKYDELEPLVLMGLLKSESFFRTFIEKISVDIFSPDYKNIIKGVYIYYKKTNKKPSVAILEKLILPKIFKNDTEDLEKSLETLTNCVCIDMNIDDHHDYLKQKTEQFIKSRRILNAVSNTIDLIKSDEDNTDQIVKLIENAVKISFDDSLGSEYFTAMEERLERSKTPVEVISTGLKGLDNKTGGGYRRKTFFVFAGPANSGKSLILNDAATTLALNGYNVAYISLELSEDYVQYRTDAKFADVSMNDININPEFAIKKAISIRNKHRKDNKPLGSLWYKEYAPNTVTTNDIRTYIKKVEEHIEGKIDFIIVDYLSLIKPNVKNSYDNKYSMLKVVCEELRSLAIINNCCVISASQTGRQSYNVTDPGMEDISESIGIVQSADFLVTIGKNQELHDENRLILNIVKSRFSKNGSSMFVKIDYEYMRLIDEDYDGGITDSAKKGKNGKKKIDKPKDEDDSADENELFPEF